MVRLQRWRVLVWVAVALLAVLRMAHAHLLWSDEDYHLAAALNVLRGKVPYRDFWYDKPPLDAFYYLIIGAHWGWALRLLDASYVLLASWLAFRLARDLWNEAEGYVAALLLAFFMAFYLPAAVIPFAADALLIVPQLAAIGCAQRAQFIRCGIWAGVGFLFNAKSLFLLAACCAWAFAGAGWVVLGFAGPVVIQYGVLAALGAWSGYVTEVWRWGFIYARSSPAADVLGNAVRRVLDWAGFNAALVFGVRWNWRIAVWIACSFAAVCVGGRFVPRYFLQLLPPLAVAASYGIVSSRRYAKLAAVLLLVPLVRFGPRYAELVADPRPHWADVQMDEDSWTVAQQLARLKHPQDTLFVWGYRPDIYVYARMTPPGLFWDSQPLTGVPADRHLSASAPLVGSEAAQNRAQLTGTAPTFIVDGLGLLNPRLSPSVYPELRAWLTHYREIGRTNLSVVYQRIN